MMIMGLREKVGHQMSTERAAAAATTLHPIANLITQSIRKLNHMSTTLECCSREDIDRAIEPLSGRNSSSSRRETVSSFGRVNYRAIALEQFSLPKKKEKKKLVFRDWHCLSFE